ncbi:MAG: hypothetical protein ACRC75_09835 [Olsenella sp.]
MTRSITSPTHLRDTQLLRTIAEMREADRLAPSGDEEPDENRHVCLTCARFTALGRYDRMTLNTLHLRGDDLEAVMSGAGICAGGKDDEESSPSLVLAEDDTCGEWEGQGTCATSASSRA